MEAETVQIEPAPANLRLSVNADVAYRAAIGLVVLAGLLLRIFGAGWGIPDYNAGRISASAYRNSYHLDEDNYLWGLVQMRPAAGDFDVRDYHWGTLQHYLIYGALLGSEAAGLVPAPWEEAFRRGDTAALPAMYVSGRLVSVLAGVLGTLIAASLGGLLGGRAAGLWAGAAYSVAPLAVVEAHYLTGDVTMSMLVAASILAAASAVRRDSLRLLILSGALLGLATAAKYSAAFALPAVLAAQALFWRSGRSEEVRRSPLPVFVLPVVGAVLGFVIGEPFAVIAPGEVLEGIRQAAQGNAPVSIWSPGLWVYLLVWHARNLGTYGLTWPLALVGLCGGGLMLLSVTGRAAGRRAPSWLQGSRLPAAQPSLIVLAGAAGLVVSLALSRVPVLRYGQPLVALFAVGAGVALAWVPKVRLRAVVGSAALGVACIVTLGQLSLMATTHTANRLLAWLDGHVQPGGTVAQVWPEYPPLDGGSYNLIRIDPWRPALPPGARPDYVIMDNMVFNRPEPGLEALLSRDYQVVAGFEARPRIGPFSWDEGVTPHDWKYTHPTFTVYARR